MANTVKEWVNANWEWLLLMAAAPGVVAALFVLVVLVSLAWGLVVLLAFGVRDFLGSLWLRFLHFPKRVYRGPRQTDRE